MKHIILVLLFLGCSFHAQDLRTQLVVPQKAKSKKKIERSSQIKRWQQQQNKRLVQGLDIPNQAQKAKIQQLYNEYDASQRRIKNKFKPSTNFDALTDREAKIQLEKSFQVGKELLDNKKHYSDEFQKVMKPQKVLKMFHQEGKMRRQLMKNRDNRSRFRKK